MWLFLRTGDGMVNWEGYQFIVNRTVVDETTTTLEASAGGLDWRPVAKVSYRVKGREMELAIRRADVGLGKGSKPLPFDFKWADNLQREGDVRDFYLSGDTAPNSRFRYRYITTRP